MGFMHVVTRGGALCKAPRETLMRDAAGCNADWLKRSGGLVFLLLEAE
jgi:hypothetical protein